MSIHLWRVSIDGSDNGLPPTLCPAITWTNDALELIVAMFIPAKTSYNQVSKQPNLITQSWSDTLDMTRTYLVLALTHWGWVTHICVGNLTIIGSDNGLSPGQRQAIIRTNAGVLLFGPLGTNFSESLVEIPTFSFKKMHLKMSSAKRWPSCLGLNVLRC